MLFALGAAATLLDGLQSLASSSQSTASLAGQAGTPFDPLGGTQTPGSSGSAAPNGFGAQISPQTMSALLDAQSAAGSTSTASLSPSAALKNLFSQIDADGNGQISKSEFENALGAGGTNIVQPDKVFNGLDTNGDGSVSLNELKSALQGAGGHHGHHFHVGGSSDGADSADGSIASNADPLMQALAGASSSSSTNSDGSTTTTITYADGSKVTMTTPAASTSTGSGSSAANSVTSSYNWIEQMIQRQAQALSANAGYSLSLSA